MKLTKTEKIFDSETGSKTMTTSCECSYSNGEVVISVDEGEVCAYGKLTKDSKSYSACFVNILNGEISNTAKDGIFAVFGSEVFTSLTFVAEETSTVTTKYLAE